MKNLKNIVIVNDFAVLNGGQAKVAIDSAKGLVKAGFQVYFFAPVGPIEQGLQEAGVKVTCLDQNDILSEPNKLISMTRGLWNYSAAKGLKQFLAQFSPEDTVIHCHGFAKALSPSIGPVMINSKIPFVYTMHEYFLACPNGGFYNYQKNEICTIRALQKECLTTNCDMRKPAHKAWRVLRQWLLKYVGKMPRELKHIIYISDTQKRALESYIDKRTQLHYLSNPISIDQKPRIQAEKNDIYLFIGRFSPEKGAALFAEAAKKAGVRAVFVGDGPEIDAVITANPKAEIVGWLPPEKVEQWIRQARCLVFPSLWYEASPLVSFEALACGLPVICGEWNAASDTLVDNVTGKVVRVRTVEGFQAAISDVADKIEEMSKAAYARYWDSPPSLSNHIENLIRLYNKIL